MSVRLKVKDIWAMQAMLKLEQMPLSKHIDQSIQRSISRWAAWRRKRLEEEVVTATKTAALREELAA